MSSGSVAPGLYLDPTALVGVRHYREVEEGVARNFSAAAIGVRVAIGLQGRNAFRAGLFVEYLTGDRSALAFGGELEMTWVAMPSWRIGPRTSIAYGDDLHGEGPQGTVGVAAHRGDIVLAADLLLRHGAFSDSYDGYTYGLLAGVGATGRTGKYTALIGGGTFLVIAGVFAVLLSGTSTH
jgi:hypothetical protein